jgi:ABC-type transporter Mla MlaB component
MAIRKGKSDMELIIDKKTKSGTLILKDDLTINRITSIRDEIIKALTKVKSLVVDAEQAAAVDLTFLQLMCSAHRTATVQNKALSLSGKINPFIKKAIQENSYARSCGCVLDQTNTCLWMGKDHE